MSSFSLVFESVVDARNVSSRSSEAYTGLFMV